MDATLNNGTHAKNVQYFALKMHRNALDLECNIINVWNF